VFKSGRNLSLRNQKNFPCVRIFDFLAARKSSRINDSLIRSIRTLDQAWLPWNRNPVRVIPFCDLLRRGRRARRSGRFLNRCTFRGRRVGIERLLSCRIFSRARFGRRISCGMATASRRKILICRAAREKQRARDNQGEPRFHNLTWTKSTLVLFQCQ